MTATTATYRTAPRERIATRVTPPAPPEFKQEFIKGGWRQVERLYGARTDLLLKWMEQVGGLAALQAERAAVRRGQASA